jgi:hypothetical protein
VGNIMQSRDEDRLEVLQLLADYTGAPPPYPVRSLYNTFVPDGHPLAHVDDAVREGGMCAVCATHHRVL